MPIQLAPIPDNPLISGYIWTLKSEDHLACLVARVYLGHYLHVENILAKLNPKAPSFGGAAAKEAKAKLLVKAGEDPWHRDGLLFQAISWVAAHQAADPAKRRAEVVCFPDLRLWMNQFAAKVRKAIDTEKSKTNV